MAKKKYAFRRLPGQKKTRKEITAEEQAEVELDAELENLEEDLEFPEETAAEVKEKAMNGVMPMMDNYQMPTSWDELDAAKTAQEMSHELDELGWDVHSLVNNILCNPMLDAKAKSQAIQEVGSGFGDRVDEILSGDYQEKDLDLLELEAVIAYDNRHLPLVEKALDFISKKKLTTKVENKLSNDQFALVREENGTTVRKYPIHDKAHVRNALARAAQMISQGGQAAADAKAALPKIRAAAKRMGIEVSMGKEKQALTIQKDASGNWRWVGWASNNFVDWDGEIISEAAHKEYVSWWENNKEFSPMFITWHTPDTMRKSAVDYVDYQNGFLIVSGPLEPDEAGALLRVQKQYDLGMSHGSLVLERDKNNTKIITKYRMYEVSDLPLSNAANPFTNLESLDTTTKEVPMAVDKLKYFAALLGSEEKAKTFLEKTGMKQKELQDAGVTSKATETPPETPPATAAPDISAEVEKVLKEKYQIDDLNVWVEKANEALDRLPVLEELVKALSVESDQKLAEKIAPAATHTLAWTMKQRASQSEETQVPEDDKLVKNKPGLDEEYWLSAVTGTQPVKAEA